MALESPALPQKIWARSHRASDVSTASKGSKAGVNTSASTRAPPHTHLGALDDDRGRTRASRVVALLGDVAKLVLCCLEATSNVDARRGEPPEQDKTAARGTLSLVRRPASRLLPLAMLHL